VCNKQHTTRWDEKEGNLCLTDSRQRRIISEKFKLCEEKMTTNGHVRSSEESHSEVKKDVKVKGIEKMSNEEIVKEIVEVREQLDVLTEQWKRDKEAHKCGWVMKKAARWPIQQLISRRQRHMLKVWIKEVDKLKADDREVCICEPEQGPILGKGDDEKRPVEGLMDSKESLDQHVEVLTEELSEAIEPHVFKTDNLCMDAGSSEGGQPFNAATEEKEKEGIPLKDVEGAQLLKDVEQGAKDAEDNDQHDGMLERCWKEIELLEHLLKEPTGGDEIVARKVADERSQQLEGNSLQYVIAGMKETKITVRQWTTTKSL
jgi:hypothetical protein